MVKFWVLNLVLAVPCLFKIWYPHLNMRVASAFWSLVVLLLPVLGPTLFATLHVLPGIQARQLRAPPNDNAAIQGD